MSICREARYLLVASRCLDFHPPTSGLREEIVDSCYTDQVRGEDLGT